MKLKKPSTTLKFVSGGPGEIHNPDDASGARSEVLSFVQHRNENNTTSIDQEKKVSK